MRCAGGHLKDAVGVCAHELADPQLAIFVARLLDPEKGALLGALLANELLPCKPYFVLPCQWKDICSAEVCQPS